MNRKFGIISMQILIFIQKKISYYPWERSLVEKDVNKKVYIFTKTKISSRTLFYTKQLFVVSDIHRGLVSKFKKTN